MSLHKDVLSTLCFYDAVGGVALTNIELYKYLITSRTSAELSFYDFLRGVDAFQTNEHTQNLPMTGKRGFYFLAKNKNGYEKRIHVGKTGIKNWKTAYKMARIISFLPYIEMIAVTGSLSTDSTTENSDIDLLIVARSGHIWTARVLVTAIMHIMGKRRHGNITRGRICLNHYIADNSLMLRPTNLFSAHILFSFIPLYSSESTENAFISANMSFSKYHMPNARRQSLNLRNIPSNGKNTYHRPKTIQVIKSVSMLLIPNACQKGIENLLKALQVQKIRRSLKNTESTEKSDIIYDDSALVFHHPRPKNQEALYLYEKNLKSLNMR